jgi:hypothetical protein
MRRREAWAPVACAALALLALTACGSRPTDPVVAGTVPGRPGTTLSPSPSAGGGGETTEVALYFTRGERLERVTRALPKVPRIGAEAVKALLAGPTDAERGAGLATAVPTGTQLNALTIDDGLARVDLSRAFETGGSGLGLTLRLAQVTCTLDAFPTVTGVRFALDGQLVDVISGDGVVVDSPVTCTGYEEYLAQGEPAEGGGGGEAFAGIWPFASRAELQAYSGGTDQTYRDPSATGRAFADAYLGMTDPAVFPFRSTGAGAGEVPVGFQIGEGGRRLPNPQPTTVIQLRQLGPQGTGGPWTVVGAAAPNIEVSSPAPLAQVASPVALAGRAHTFEGNVNVEVREDGMTFGRSLGAGFVTGRGDALGPFQGSVTFRSPTQPGGAVVFMERNSADGGTPVLRATVVRVRF